jgi:hypothetical protein
LCAIRVQVFDMKTIVVSEVSYSIGDSKIDWYCADEDRFKTHPISNNGIKKMAKLKFRF